jgi:endonuclease-3 related protein
MPTWATSFAAIVTALAEHYGVPGSQGVAAGLDAFPAIVTVLLARATDPHKAARALDALADAGLLDPGVLSAADHTETDATLKSAGITVPARALGSLRRLARWFAQRQPGDGAGSLDLVATESLRAELAGINGVGPATADALLLLALSRPVYPLDRATCRILIRHGWLDPSAEYDEARDLIERPAADDPVTLARLSDGLARIGNEFCRVRVAKCDRCPLRRFLPEGGPIEPEGAA